MRRNPVELARLDLELSQGELAEKSDLASNTIRYIEKGMYTRIPMKLIEVLLPLYPMIIPDYQDWQRERRLETRRQANFNLDPPFPEFYSHEFFREEILGLSMNEFCARHCVERKMVYHWEKNPNAKVPVYIRAAIEEVYGTAFAEHYTEQLTPEWI